jgi:hypothetical protein
MLTGVPGVARGGLQAKFAGAPYRLEQLAI